MSCKVVLTLWGDLQSYGTDSMAYDRGAGDFPSRSAVTGMILCALGADGAQEELLSTMASGFHMEVQSFGERTLLDDYHTISSQYKDLSQNEESKVLKDWYSGMCLRAAEPGKDVQGSGNKISKRQYWTNRVFFVILDFKSKALARKVSSALLSPVGTLVLGRKCCPPKVPIHHGVICETPEEVQQEIDISLHGILTIMAGRGKKPELTPSGVCSEKPLDNSQKWVRNDVPVQFGRDKVYRSREVWVASA